MNASEDQTEPLGESPDIDTLTAIERAAELGMLSAADKATALKQLAERADSHLAKRAAAADPYRPADRLGLTLPAAIEQAEILAGVVRVIKERNA